MKKNLPYCWTIIFKKGLKTLNIFSTTEKSKLKYGYVILISLTLLYLPLSWLHACSVVLSIWVRIATFTEINLTRVIILKLVHPKVYWKRLTTELYMTFFCLLTRRRLQQRKEIMKKLRQNRSQKRKKSIRSTLKFVVLPH